MVVGQPTPPSTFLRDSSRGAGDRPRQGNPPISSDPKVDSKAPRGTDRVSQALVPPRLGDIFGVGRPPRSSSVPVRPPNQTLASTEAAPPPGPGCVEEVQADCPQDAPVPSRLDVFPSHPCAIQVLDSPICTGRKGNKQQVRASTLPFEKAVHQDRGKRADKGLSKQCVFART